MMEARRVCDYVDPIARTHLAQMMAVLQAENFELAFLASDEKKSARRIQCEAARTVASVLPSRDDGSPVEVDRERAVGPEVCVGAAARAIDHQRLGTIGNFYNRGVI